MKTQRITAFTLAILVSLLASCGSPASTAEVTTAGDTTTGPVVTEPAEISDELPDVKFNGKTFTTLTYDQLIADYQADEANGDVVNDAVWERNQKVMDRFDVTLETLSQPLYNNTTDYIKTTVLSGEETFQIAAHHVVSLGTLALNDVFMNWYEIPYINFEKPWWSPSTIEDLTYDGVTLIAVGDYSLSSLAATYCYFYDKQAAVDYKFDDLYKVVDDGKWTIDYVMELVKDIYVDLNGNAQKDEADYYGLTSTTQSALNTYLWSSGNKIFTNNKDGSKSMTYNNARTVDIIEKLYKLCYETEGVCMSRPTYETLSGSKHYIAALSFRDNLSALIPGTLDMTVNYFRERKGEYGILPYPKLDEEQDEYKTMVDGYHAALAIPKTISDPEFVGIITEALNAESNKIVFPAYYEVALKVKYAHDDESVQMLDKIVNSRVFDFGYVYGGWSGVAFMFQGIVGENKSKDFASYYASKGPAAEQYYQDVIDYFNELRQ